MRDEMEEDERERRGKQEYGGNNGARSLARSLACARAARLYATILSRSQLIVKSAVNVHKTVVQQVHAVAHGARCNAARSIDHVRTAACINGARPMRAFLAIARTILATRGTRRKPFAVSSSRSSSYVRSSAYVAREGCLRYRVPLMRDGTYVRAFKRYLTHNYAQNQGIREVRVRIARGDYLPTTMKRSEREGRGSGGSREESLSSQPNCARRAHGMHEACLDLNVCVIKYRCCISRVPRYFASSRCNNAFAASDNILAKRADVKRTRSANDRSR